MNNRLKNRRSKLLKESNLCRRCGVEMVMPEGAGDTNDNVATIQHLYDILHPLRKDPTDKFDTDDIDLWCYKCNRDDNMRIMEERRAALALFEPYMDLWEKRRIVEMFYKIKENE